MNTEQTIKAARFAAGLPPWESAIASPAPSPQFIGPVTGIPYPSVRSNPRPVVSTKLAADKVRDGLYTGDVRPESVGGPYPWIVVAIDNPTGVKPGTYYYVQNPDGIRGTFFTRSLQSAIDWAASRKKTGSVARPSPRQLYAVDDEPDTWGLDYMFNPNPTQPVTGKELLDAYKAVKPMNRSSINVLTNLLYQLRAQ